MALDLRPVAKEGLAPSGFLIVKNQFYFQGKTRELMKIALFSCFTTPHSGPTLPSMWHVRNRLVSNNFDIK